MHEHTEGDHPPLVSHIAPPPEPKDLTPLREQERLHTLDALRGVALLGILLVNMQFFAMPMLVAVGMVDLPEASAPDRLAWAFVKVFCEFKFVSMFSLLFGAGTVMQLVRAREANRPFWAMYLRRLAVLFVFGALHATLLWYGDILLIYACVGVAMLGLSLLTPRVLVIIAVILLALSTMITTGATAMQVVMVEQAEQATIDAEAARADAAAAADAEATIDGEPPSPTDATDPSDTSGEDALSADETSEQASPLRGFDAMNAAGWDPSHETWIDAELNAYQNGPFGEAFLFRMVSYAFAVIGAMFGFGWRIMAMFMIGGAFMKLGWFRAEHRVVHTRLMLLGLIGLPLEVAAAAVVAAGEHQMSWALVLAAPLHEIGSVLLCLGYVGVVCRLSAGGGLGIFRATGRMALTVYLSETLIATGIMYWWGMGMFGEISRPMQLALCVAIYAVLVVAANIWMSMFRMGPMEWLWRSLTYCRPQRLRRDPAPRGESQ